jgi:phage-related minor tail protein
MPPTSPTPQPAQQVERIREILVGRQMQSVERRLDRLESQLQPMPVESAAAAWSRDLESLRQECRDASVTLRDAFDADRLRQQEETQKLARRIESVARSRQDLAEEARQAVDAQLRPGFDRWQRQLFEQLQERETRLVGQLREELERMRAWVREEMSAPAEAERIHLAFEQLAASAREIADRFPSRSS